MNQYQSKDFLTVSFPELFFWFDIRNQSFFWVVLEEKIHKHFSFSIFANPDAPKKQIELRKYWKINQWISIRVNNVDVCVIHSSQIQNQDQFFR